ncbi:putative potassium channel, voltage-dependent, ERG [Rosa chinensis]|uniref:Putative potassium channel, voltage-dependent, ERG n=1 Tax=Rosa chinensis TaxID=74649 RepID=A0A2P6SDL6_ROSCH|nr:uncharacterized protein LOC112194100 [Rosa chinensis]PRQ56770.1 putative potassium channel, voltage-dependent, ERG [Rosa chinensis]
MLTWEEARAILSLIWVTFTCFCEWVPHVLVWMVAAPIFVPLVAIQWACKPIATWRACKSIAIAITAIRWACKSIAVAIWLAWKSIAVAIPWACKSIAVAIPWAWKAFLDIPSAKWEHVFVISCIAVSLDPLFFYIPTIDETNKCLSMDKKMRTTALVFRSLTDAHLVLHIKDQICDRVDSDYPNWSDSDSNSDSDSDTYSDSHSGAPSSSLKKRMQWLSFSIIVNCLAILPIPQVATSVGFYPIGAGSSASEVSIKRAAINLSLALQYLPRVCQIYLSSKKFRTSGRWIKPSLNLFLYILSSHIFAAFWYFFAIGREISCWYQTCKDTAGCVADFDCSSPANTSRNIAVLNQFCPINSPNSTVFDFGIYLPILQSGNTGSVSFTTKFFYSLWWGLKNLSNFGTNLETSTYKWENCFAIVICVSGLLLFLYFIGNMQIYMELDTTKSLKTQESRRQKIKAKKAEIKKWMSNNGISGNMETGIKDYIKHSNVLEKNIKADVDVTYFLDGNRFGNSSIREPLLEHLVRNAVKQVPLIQKMQDVSGLKTLCRYMKPVVYNKDHALEVQELVQMIFIIQGEIDQYCTETSSNFKRLSKGDCYGLQIQDWAARNYMRSYYDPLPTFTGWVRCQTRVEAFELKAMDLMQIITQQNFDSEQLKKLAGIEDNTDQIPNEDDLQSIPQCEQLDPDWVKLSCSVVWNPETKKARTGYVCRDARGAFLGAESRGGLEFRDRFLAEADNINKAIAFFTRNKFKGGVRIVVESDNKDLIECLCMPNLESNERLTDVLRPVLEEIIKSASKFKSKRFKHCKRQSNAAANCIARHAVDSPNPSSWIRNAPDWLLNILNQDSLHLQEKSPSEQNQELRVDIEPEKPPSKKNQELRVDTEPPGPPSKKNQEMRVDIEPPEPPSKKNQELRVDIEPPELLSEQNQELTVDIEHSDSGFMNFLGKKGHMDADVDVDVLFANPPSDIKQSKKRHLGLNALKKVPMLQKMHEYVLEVICNHLEPKVYERNSYVVRAREPLGLMIFILRGTIGMTDTTSSNATTTGSSEITESRDDKILREGDFYGEQLLSWASPNNISSSDNPVISAIDVRCQTKVEALILKAEDLKSVASKCGSQWNFDNCMNSQQLVDDGRDRVANTAPTSTIEETIRLHQGHDIILEQLVLIRETIFRRLDDQGRKLDEMAAFLAREGYTGITGASSTPSAP